MKRYTYYIRTTDGKKRGFLEAYGNDGAWLNGQMLSWDGKEIWELITRVEELDDEEDN